MPCACNDCCVAVGAGRASKSRQGRDCNRQHIAALQHRHARHARQPGAGGGLKQLMPPLVHLLDLSYGLDLPCRCIMTTLSPRSRPQSPTSGQHSLISTSLRSQFDRIGGEKCLSVCGAALQAAHEWLTLDICLDDAASTALVVHCFTMIGCIGGSCKHARSVCQRKRACHPFTTLDLK